MLTATVGLGQEAKKPQAQYIYKTVGDRQLAIQMSYPPDWKATDKRPAIVFFFGGIEYWEGATQSGHFCRGAISFDSQQFMYFC